MSGAQRKTLHQGLLARIGAGAALLVVAAWGHGVLAAAPIVADVAMQPGGVLEGRVLAAEAGSPGASAVPRRVFLVRAGEILAEASVDRQGRFTLQRLSPGMVEAVVDAPDGNARQSCRLWTATAAPAGASSELRLSPTPPSVIRGQGGLLTMGFRKAAVIAGVAAGAVAAPIIHHNIRQANQPPASP